jgi:sugar O-acyltransferase (sialic acid O-acetyltransferase NeuD family)
MDCILVGASPKARLILDFLADEGRSNEVIGFVDRDTAKKGQTFGGKPIMGDLSCVLEQGLQKKHAFCICLSEQRFDERNQYMRWLSEVDAKFASIVSRRSVISSSAGIEPGSIVFPGATINAGSKIGTCVTIYTGALIDHDCTIANNVEISPRVAMAGSVSVDAGAFLGMNATILPNIAIGAGTIIGAGAVVTRDVAAGDVVAGNPARILRSSPQ